MFKILITLTIFLASCVSSVQEEVEPIQLDIKESSYILYDLERKEVLDSYGRERSLIPASVFKIFTAYAALEVLGYKRKFETKIYYDGVIEDGGILVGDLVVVGKGDPSLEYQDIHNIVRLLKLKGIKEIEGRILYSDNYFMAASQISIDQPPSIYNPGLSALVLKNSNFHVEFDEDSRELITVPKLDYLDFDINRKAKNPEYLGDKSWKIRRATHRLPIKDTSYFVMDVFRQVLKNNGINVSGVGVISDLSRTRLLLTYQSKPLIDIVRENLQYSQNLVSEVLLLHISKKLKCEVNSLYQASECLKDWYAKRYSYLDWSTLEWQNGSGLSTSTRITADHVLALLKDLDKARYGNQFGPSLLAVSGVKGTLLKRFRDQALNIWGKTGNLYFISGVAGFLYSNDTRYAFVMMVNDSEARDEIDELQHDVKRHNDYIRSIKQAKLWKKDVVEHQEQIIDKWLKLIEKEKTKDEELL